MKVTLSNGRQIRLVKNEQGEFEARFNLSLSDLENGFSLVNEDGSQF